MRSSEVISNFLTDRLGIDPAQVQPSSLLADLGVDSLMLAELMFEAEDRLGIEIPTDVPLPKTVADMQAVLDSLTPLRTG